MNPADLYPCDAGAGLNLAAMRDLRAALQGKRLVNGRVDHSSRAETPHLQLHIVTYEHQIASLATSALIAEGLVDGVSLWISGPRQDTLHTNLTAFVAQTRQAIGTTLPLYTGGYLTYSSIGYMRPAPFYDLLTQSVAMYDVNQIQGFYVFAGTTLSRMNASVWAEWELPSHLNESLWPWVGGAVVRVLDAATKQPIPGALAVVKYNSSTPVTRKLTTANGSFSFGGWAGQSRAAPHSVTLSASGYATATSVLQLQPGRAEHSEIKLHAVAELAGAW